MLFGYLVAVMPLLRYEEIATSEALLFRNHTFPPIRFSLVVGACHHVQFANAFHLASFGGIHAMSSNWDLLLVICVCKQTNQIISVYVNYQIEPMPLMKS